MSASNPNQSGGTTSLLRIARTECRAAVAFLALPVDDNMFATATYPVLSEEDVVSVTALDELLHEIWDDAELAPGKVLIHSVQAGSRRLVRSKRTEVALVRLDNGPDGRPLGLLGVAGPSGGVFGNDIHGLGALGDRVSSYLRARQQVRHWVTHDPSTDPTRTPESQIISSGPMETIESSAPQEAQPAMPESLAEAISSDFEPQAEAPQDVTPEPAPEPEDKPAVVRLTERMAERREAAEREIAAARAAASEPDTEPASSSDEGVVEETDAETEIEATEPDPVEVPEPVVTEPEIVASDDDEAEDVVEAEVEAEPEPEPQVTPIVTPAVEPAAVITPSADETSAEETQPSTVEPEVVVSATKTTPSRSGVAAADPLQDLLAGNDPVTGMPPLTSLLGRMGRMLGAAQSADAALAVVAIEIPADHASEAGQRAAAEALRAQLRFDDPVAHIGQSVFATALPFVTGITSGESIERGLMQAVKAAVAGSDSEAEIRAAHIVTSLAGGDDADQLLRLAVEKLRAT
jgi:hypothetical protein